MLDRFTHTHRHTQLPGVFPASCVSCPAGTTLRGSANSPHLKGVFKRLCVNVADDVYTADDGIIAPHFKTSNGV